MKDLNLLEQKSLIDSYLNQGLRPLSSFSFVSIFAWCDFFDFELNIIDDCLCILAHSPSGAFLYLPPLGRVLKPSTVPAVFKKMSQGKPLKAVNRIENIPENLLCVFEEGKYNQYAKPAEYVYRKEDLTGLHGNAYKSQRHDYNHFAAHHPGYSFEAYTDEDLNDCLDLYQHWAAHREASHPDEIYRAMLDENYLVHQRLLKYWKSLDLVVRTLKIEGKLIGYTFGFALDEITFCVYAEIADLSIPGTAASLFKHFCSDEALKRFKRINTMDDFAMPQVARSKQAYHPSERIPSYTISTP